VRVEEERQPRREVVDVEPTPIAASTYAKPSASVKASSWIAFEPASGCGKPEIEIGCTSASPARKNSTQSVRARIDGSAGRSILLAMYSLRMSVWIVRGALPARRPAARRRRRRTQAASPPAH